MAGALSGNGQMISGYNNESLTLEQLEKIKSEQQNEVLNTAVLAPSATSAPSATAANSNLLALAKRVNEVAHIALTAETLETAAAAAATQQDADPTIPLIPAPNDCSRSIILSKDHHWYIFNDVLIGQGNSKRVCLACDLLGKDIISAAGIISVDNMSKEQLSLIDREVEIMDSLKTVPYVVQCLGYVQTLDQRFILTEYCSSGDLWNAVYNENLTPKQQLFIASQIIHALAEIHERGVVHCDFKLENILLTKDCLIKVLDFGVSHLITDEMDARGGTFAYLSPEMALAVDDWNNGVVNNNSARHSNSLNPLRDVWAAGVVLYQMFTHEEPWELTDMNILLSMAAEPIKYQKKIDRLIDTNASIPNRMKPFLKDMLTIDPEQRSTAKEMLKWL